MYQSKEKIQTVVLLLADLICFVISYFGGGYLWLVLYRNVSVQNMKSELMDSFGIVLVIYMLILLFSDLEKNFIRRNLARDFWAALEASVIMIFVTALTIFLQHNNADASRGVYFCIAGMNLCCSSWRTRRSSIICCTSTATSGGRTSCFLSPRRTA